MDAKVEAVLRGYAQRIQAEDKVMREHSYAELSKRLDDFLLPVGPATGALLNLLAKEAKAKQILEIGTSYGYSTVWLAEAAAATGGKVITLEIHPRKIEYARDQLGKAGLSQHVEFRQGDALETLRSLAGPFDFVLIDLWKDLYVPSFDLLYPKLAAGAVIFADNMIQPEAAREMANAYRAHVRSKPDISTVLLPVGSGVELSRYR